MNTVVVTGAATGLGLETALYLAQKGFWVYATTRDEEQRAGVHAAAATRRVEVQTLRLDVRDRRSIEAAIAAIVREAGGIYGLVNNAGLDIRGCFEDVSEAQIRALYDVNVFGTMAVTRQVLPSMRAAGNGRIVTITSVAGRIATFGLAPYCSSKFALEGFAETLSLELAPFGVRSIIVEPGIVKTPLWGANRLNGVNALNPASPYHSMFVRHEAIADRRVARSRIKPVHVAMTVHRALTERHPRLRYVVGPLPSALISLRRHLPGELFERLYFGLLLPRLLGATPAKGGATTGVYPLP